MRPRHELWRIATLSVLVWLPSCAGNSGNRSAQAAAVPAPAAVAPAAAGTPAAEPAETVAEPADPACATLPPALAAYDAITDAAFSLELARDERGAWGPARSLAMPYHHASTIVWTDDAHLLEGIESARLVVIATGLGRLSIEHDAERSTWFATYGARVDHVCPAAGR